MVPSSMRFFCTLKHQKAGRIYRMVNSRRAHINSNFFAQRLYYQEGYIHSEMVASERLYSWRNGRGECSNLTFIACSKKCHHKTNDNNVVFHFLTDIFEGFLGVLGVLHPCTVLSPVSHKKMLPNCQRQEWCVTTFQVILFIFLKHFVKQERD